MSAPALPALSSLVSRKERTFYVLMLAISLAIYGGVGFAIVTYPDVVAPFVGTALMYVLIFALAIWFTHGMMLGRVRGNGIRVSARQLPAVHRQVQEHARSLQLKKAPDVYVIESGGIMNAFATRFFGREFVVIHSDIREL